MSILVRKLSVVKITDLVQFMKTRLKYLWAESEWLIMSERGLNWVSHKSDAKHEFIKSLVINDFQRGKMRKIKLNKMGDPDTVPIKF